MCECLPRNCKDCELYPCDMPQNVIKLVEQGENIYCTEFILKSSPTNTP